MAAVRDAPFRDPSHIPTYLIAEYARGYTLRGVLSGDGADELFGGPAWYSLLATSTLDEIHQRVCRRQRSQTTLTGRVKYRERFVLFRGEYRPLTDTTGMGDMRHFDLMFFLPGDIVVKVDRAAVAHGRETRAPFLDWGDLGEFALSLPSTLKVKALQHDSLPMGRGHASRCPACGRNSSMPGTTIPESC